jgi:hypothetical protein
MCVCVAHGPHPHPVSLLRLKRSDHTFQATACYMLQLHKQWGHIPRRPCTALASCAYALTGDSQRSDSLWAIYLLSRRPVAPQAWGLVCMLYMGTANGVSLGVGGTAWQAPLASSD